MSACECGAETTHGLCPKGCHIRGSKPKPKPKPKLKKHERST